MAGDVWPDASNTRCQGLDMRRIKIREALKDRQWSRLEDFMLR